MNSNYGRSSQSGSFNNFDFDLGINSNRSKPLNGQKSSSFTEPNKPNTTSSWQSNKPSWTHQPAAPTQSSGLGGLNGPTSMVGDITGRSWASVGPQRPSSNVDVGIGIVNKNPNLFSDLLGPNLGVNKGSGGDVPLKNAAPIASQAANRNVYSMGGMADSLPKASNPMNGAGGNRGTPQGFGNYNTSGYGNKSQNLGGPAMKSSAGSGIQGGMGSNKDPFGNLVDFSSKPAAGMKAGNKMTDTGKSADDAFGAFEKASKPATNVFSSSTSFTGSGVGSQSKLDDFGFGGMQNRTPLQSSGGGGLDDFFTSSSASAVNAAKSSEDFVSQTFQGSEDWGFESGPGGGADAVGTTELEGLPPPPAGVTASTAKNKGMDNYKAGQYPDAIKWLSWALILFEKVGDNAGTNEVLASRASCYKEVGEYKKAVADCSKVLEQDGKNVSVLVQRALLYESMEKYKLGADDLRTVMNIDPGNRVARSTIHRLTKLAC